MFIAFRAAVRCGLCIQDVARGHRLAVPALALLAGCMTPPAAPPVAPRQPTTVAAPSARVWDAVVDVFAERNIPIANMDRASGFIATEALTVSEADRMKRAAEWADCGRAIGIPISPHLATYNILVRGDSASATVRATVRWTFGEAPQRIECRSRGSWEASIESDIKARAEAQ